MLATLRSRHLPGRSPTRATLSRYPMVTRWLAWGRARLSRRLFGGREASFLRDSGGDRREGSVSPGLTHVCPSASKCPRRGASLVQFRGSRVWQRVSKKCSRHRRLEHMLRFSRVSTTTSCSVHRMTPRDYACQVTPKPAFFWLSVTCAALERPSPFSKYAESRRESDGPPKGVFGCLTESTRRRSNASAPTGCGCRSSAIATACGSGGSSPQAPEENVWGICGRHRAGCGSHGERAPSESVRLRVPMESTSAFLCFGE